MSRNGPCDTALIRARARLLSGRTGALRGAGARRRPPRPPCRAGMPPALWPGSSAVVSGSTLGKLRGSGDPFGRAARESAGFRLLRGDLPRLIGVAALLPAGLALLMAATAPLAGRPPGIPIGRPGGLVMSALEVSGNLTLAVPFVPPGTRIERLPPLASEPEAPLPSRR